MGNIERKAMAAIRAHFQYLGLAGPTLADAHHVVDALINAGMLGPSAADFRGAVEDAATGRALVDRMFELPRGPEWEQALAELRVWCMDPQQLGGR